MMAKDSDNVLAGVVSYHVATRLKFRVLGIKNLVFIFCFVR